MSSRYNAQKKENLAHGRSQPSSRKVAPSGITAKLLAVRAAQNGRGLWGRAIYSVAEAARLLQLSLQTTRRWAARYDFTDAGAPQFSRPLIRAELGRRHRLVELSFFDLIELLFVKAFHERGVSLPVIRKAAKHTSEILRSTHPFGMRHFKTDGFTIFARLSQAESLPKRSFTATDSKLIDLKNGQHEFSPIVTPFLQQFEYNLKTDLVRQGWPLRKEKQIVVAPPIDFGPPFIAELGVAARNLLRSVVRLARSSWS